MTDKKIWFEGMPTKAGIYLRHNPPIHAIVRQDVFEQDGHLFCAHGGSMRLTPIEQMPKSFWWYGPIPLPPKGRAKDDK